MSDVTSSKFKFVIFSESWHDGPLTIYATPRRWIYWWLRRRTPHRVTQRWWLYRVKETDCVVSISTKETGAKVIRADVYGEGSSVAFSRSIGMELDSEGSIISTFTEYYKFNFESIGMELDSEGSIVSAFTEYYKFKFWRCSSLIMQWHNTV